jgi:hypothetical protein
MPRVIVTTDPTAAAGSAAVLLDESVHTVHLDTDHAAAALVERIAWAITDAEDAERGRDRDGRRTEAPARSQPRPRRAPARSRRRPLPALGTGR